MIDDRTNKLLNTIAVGESPDTLSIDPDSRTVYVVTSCDNTVFGISNKIGNEGHSVSVVDGASETLLADVNVGRLPTSVAVNANTHQAYVTNVDSSTISVITP